MQAAFSLSESWRVLQRWVSASDLSSPAPASAESRDRVPLLFQPVPRGTRVLEKHLLFSGYICYEEDSTGTSPSNVSHY